MLSKKFIFALALGLLSVYWLNAYAALNAYVSTQENQAITFDISNNITETYTTIVATQPQQGNLSQQGSGPVFTYTPAAGFAGVDSFDFELRDQNLQLVGAASVIINVGAVNTTEVLGSPGSAISGKLNGICVQNTNQDQSLPPSLVDICSDYVNATPAELAKMVNELAPKEIGGQNQLSSNMANQQVDNARKRMASLRQGMSGSGIGALSVDFGAHGTHSLAKLLNGEQRGGAASADTERLGVFLSGKIGGGSHGENPEEDGYSMKSRGLTAGVDYRVNNQFVTGAALGNNYSSMDTNNNGGGMDISGFNAMVYGSYFMSQKAYVEAVAAAYLNSIEANRVISYTINGQPRSATANAQTDNGMLSVSLGTGYEAYYNKGFTLNVSANLDYIKTAFDGYAETGAAGANLVMEKREASQLTYTLNLQGTYPLSYASYVLIPQFDFMWKHEFDEEATLIEGRFKNDVNETRFRFSTEAPDTDYFKLNLGMSSVVPGGNTGYVYYEKTLGKSGYSEYSISLGMRFVF